MAKWIIFVVSFRRFRKSRDLCEAAVERRDAEMKMVKSVFELHWRWNEAVGFLYRNSRRRREPSVLNQITAFH